MMFAFDSLFGSAAEVVQVGSAHMCRFILKSSFWQSQNLCIALRPGRARMLAMEKHGFVYILSSKGKRLYTGVTSQLAIRIRQHKARVPGSHTAKYNIDQLVYYEEFGSVVDAINREAQIKNMGRLQKIAMIVAVNPDWVDLSLAFGKQAEPFEESKMRNPIGFLD